MTNLDIILKSRDYFTKKTPSSQSYGFSSSHVQMWESWTPKNWCFWTGVLEKTLEGPLDCKEIQPVHPKGNQSWIFIESTDAKVEAPILCQLDVKSFPMAPWKRPWCQERLEAGGEGDNRGWDGWKASLTQWIWVWANSGGWWRTEKSGTLQSLGSQRVRHDWAAEQQQASQLMSPRASLQPKHTKVQTCQTLSPQTSCVYNTFCHFFLIILEA